jgi:hypothetical protein
MKFEWIVDFKVNEVEVRLIIDMIVGILALLGGIFFDLVAGKFALQHSASIGTHQLLWIAFWGVYVTWTGIQFKSWKE